MGGGWVGGAGAASRLAGGRASSTWAGDGEKALLYSSQMAGSWVGGGTPTPQREGWQLGRPQRERSLNLPFYALAERTNSSIELGTELLLEVHARLSEPPL